MRRIEIAAAMILEGGSMLVVRKQGSAVFMQPGGKLEPGEMPDAALCRELDEEIAIALAPSALAPLGTFSAPAADQPDSIVVAHLFAARIGQPPAARAEIAEIAWLPLDGPHALPLAPLTADIVMPLARRRAAVGGAGT